MGLSQPSDNLRSSGHGVLMGKTQRQWQDQDAVLAHFVKTEATRAYRLFVAGGMDMGGDRISREGSTEAQEGSQRLHP
jgi:hypothetical protein